MKTKLFVALLTFLFSSTLINAKDKTQGDNTGFKRLYVGISVTPIAGYRWVHKNFVPSGQSDSQVNGVVETTNKNDLPQIGVVAGITGGIRLTHWLAIE